MQVHPQSPVLNVYISHRHCIRGTDASEGVDHQPDQGAIAQAGWRAHIDAVEELVRLAGSSTRAEVPIEKRRAMLFKPSAVLKAHTNAEGVEGKDSA